MSASTVRSGDVFPDIEGDTPAGHVRVADFRGSKHVVVWTYPKDDTPG